MNNRFMDIHRAENVLSGLIKLHGVKKVDIGALEPFMHPYIIELLMLLERLGLRYSITSNGSLLYKYINNLLKLDNLLKLRISFHTLDKNFFSKISRTNYFDNVYKSIIESKKVGLPIELNCISLRGYERHMLEVVDFSVRNNLNIKIYNLYFMPQYESLFYKYFMSSEDIINVIISHYKNVKINIEKYEGKRDRIILQINNVKLTVKNDKKIDRKNEYCRSCRYKSVCGEEFAEYLRVNPDFTFYPCYLRKDLKFDLRDNKSIEYFKKIKGSLSIRLIVSAVCNFRCSFPEEGVILCLKQGWKEYIWKN